MSHKSGCKLDETSKDCLVELTYFGVFAQSIQSQTLKIRSVEDLIDIVSHLEDFYARKIDDHFTGEEK